MRGARGALLAFAVLALAGCADKQNTLAPASKQEHEISTLFRIMMTGAWIDRLLRDQAGLPGAPGRRARREAAQAGRGSGITFM